jgi:glutamate racemase
VRRLAGPKVRIISQNDVVPAKFADYLRRHPEMDNRLSRGGKRTFAVTKLTKDFSTMSRKWFGRRILLRRVKY